MPSSPHPSSANEQASASVTDSIESFQSRLFRLPKPWARRLRNGLPLLVMLLGVLASGIAFDFSKRQVEMAERLRFEERAAKVAQTLFEGMEIFEHGLHGVRGLFVASKSVERDEFRRMIESRDLAVEFPGAMGMGYIDRIPRDSVAAYVQATRADEAPWFELKFLDTLKGDPYVIRFVEPDSINRPAIGLVINSESKRREAANHAMLSGKATLTAPISLVQADKKFTGFLYLLPEYGPGPMPTSEAERVQRLRGWAYSPLVMEPLIEKYMNRVGSNLNLEITDVQDPENPESLYRSILLTKPIRNRPRTVQNWNYTTLRKVGQRDLQLVLKPLPGFESLTVIWVPRLILFGGIFASLLTSLLIATWLRTRQKAEAMAEAMTMDLRRARDESEKANLAKSRFLAVMSHEIRTPMNGVLGMAQLLRSTPLNEEQADYVRAIQSSGDNLLEIINDILDFSKIEAGKIELNPHPFDLRTLCEEILEIMAFKAHGKRREEKGVELVLLAPVDKPLWYFADDLRIRQVITNLVSNALKFTHQGHVTVTVSEKANAAGHYTVIQVSDSGIGISHEALGNLFKEFTQADATTTRRYGGTGLGLAICKRLCLAMGGDIDATSEVGRGSVFTMRLPLEKIAGKQAPLPIVLPSGQMAFCVSDAGLRQSLQMNLRVEAGSLVLEPELLALQKNESIIREKAGACIIDLDPMVATREQPAQDQLALHAVRSILSLFGEAVPILFLATFNKPKDFPGSSKIEWLQKPVKYQALARAMASCLRETRVPPLKIQGDSASHADASMMPATKPDWKPAITSGTVLLAEDNAVNRMVAVKMLERAHCRVDTVENGMQALAQADRNRYDMIFMDCEMPEMDGYEAARRIRQGKGPNCETPIIAFTANALAADRERCLEAGMNDIVHKPVKESLLFDAVRQWLGSLPNPVIR